ncbi:hypothetical protein NF552_14370 [Roseomonas mucosa]|nr:hypothetical protein NF552_14370 [Roseomonas mucosa]
MLENRLRHSEGARVKLKKSITGWLRRHGVTDPIVLVGRENSRKHGEHSHWIIACPPHLVAALVEHVQKALLRIDQRDALPPRTWWWTRPTVVRPLRDGTTRRVAAGWSFSEHAVKQGHLPYALKQLVPPGEWIEGVFGTHDRRPPGRRLRVVTRRTARRPVRFYPDKPDPLAAAPAACRGHEPRPILVVAKPVAGPPPAPQERPQMGGNRMNSFTFRPVLISEGGRQAVLKSRGSTGLTAAGVQAYIGGAIRRGARLSAEQVGLAAGRVRELIPGGALARRGQRVAQAAG